MKPKTFLRLTLLIPYLLWGISAIFMLVVSSLPTALDASSPIINTLAMIPILYSFGIVLWGIPYTLLAVGLWLWSRGKPTKKIIKTFAWAPILLIVPMMIETLIMDYRSFRSYSELARNWQSFWSGFAYSTVTLTGLSLAFGYLCIGLAYGVYKLLWKLKLILDEQENIPQITN